MIFKSAFFLQQKLNDDDDFEAERARRGKESAFAYYMVE